MRSDIPGTFSLRALGFAVLNGDQDCLFEKVALLQEEGREEALNTWAREEQATPFPHQLPTSFLVYLTSNHLSPSNIHYMLLCFVCVSFH